MSLKIRKLIFKDLLRRIKFINSSDNIIIKISSNNTLYYTNDIYIYPVEYMNYKIISIESIIPTKKDKDIINNKFKINGRITLIEIKLIK